MQYTFPTAPIVHEPTLRSHAALLFSDTSSASLFASPNECERATHMSSFALVTAVCASISSVVPETLLSYGPVVAAIFLQASRETLKAYEDYDLEHPNSASLSIRDLQSVALQHVTGKKGIADHVLGEAGLIALKLRLYNEQAVVRSDPIEAQLLRLSFWHLYSADKAAASLESRAYILHEGLFVGGLTLLPSAETFTPLMDTDTPWDEEPFEERLLVGFQLIPHLWGSAARLLASMRAYDKAAKNGNGTLSALTRQYLDFVGVIDGLPHWLQVSNLIASPEDSAAVSRQKKSFWVQRCTSLMTFHCLRLVILQQCIDSGLWDVMGLSDQPLALAMKKAETIQDFVQTTDDIPFIYHQIKGEPNVERIRRVGTILLEMIQNVDNEAIKERARSYFARLLDTLTRLDSKVSEEL
ncbi:hypothetical protein QBC46DRAFT_396517, partial [Diplogelasinospora grovesii]